MSVNPMNLPAPLRAKVEATRTFRNATALLDRLEEPERILSESQRLARESHDSAAAADWLLSKHLLPYAQRCASKALAAACAAAVLQDSHAARVAAAR